MILLNTVTKSLQIILGSSVTTELTWVANYVDIDQTNFALTSASGNDGTTNGTSAVTMVPVPPSSTTREIKSLTVANSGASSATVTIRILNVSTVRPIWTGVLSAGDTLFFMDGHGWSVLDGTGQNKVPFSNTSASLTTLTGVQQDLSQQILFELRRIALGLELLNGQDISLDDISTR